LTPSRTKEGKTFKLNRLSFLLLRTIGGEVKDGYEYNKMSERQLAVGGSRILALGIENIPHRNELISFISLLAALLLARRMHWCLKGFKIGTMAFVAVSTKTKGLWPNEL
jgi:hypothetical protein